MHCPQCGAETVEGAKFCGACGSPLPQVDETSQVDEAPQTASDPVEQAEAPEPQQAEAPERPVVPASEGTYETGNEPVATPPTPGAQGASGTGFAGAGAGAGFAGAGAGAGAGASYGQPGQPGQPGAYAQGSYRANGKAVLYPRSSTDDTMLMIAFILNIVATACFGLAIIPLAWMVPMTVVSYGVWKGTRRNTVAFGVCTLIFVNLISGVLMLVAEKNE